MIAAIREKMHIRRNDKIVYIGDTIVDYQTAKNAHVKCVLVTYGFRSKEETMPYINKRTPTVNSLWELINYLDQYEIKLP